MSAIFGLVRWDGRAVTPDDLDRMSQKLRHRGSGVPDTWCDGSVGLGLRRQQPHSRGIERRPHDCADGAALTITGDVRIDNRRELLDALGLDPESDALSDLGLVLAVYARWGRECAARIVGDFAFAIWDGRLGELFCARDPIGLRSFFYHQTPSAHFVFGSEIQALLTVRGVPRRLRPVRVAHYLLYAYEGKSVTFYDDILRLPPGHTLIVSRESCALECYWSPASLPALACRSDEEYAEAFRELFMESVRCRLPSDGVVGASFSGGLDSSSVVTVVRHLTRGIRLDPLQTFTITWGASTQADESPYVESVVSGGGIQPHYTPGDSVNPFFDFAQLPMTLDEPPDNPLSRSGWLLREQVSQSGALVLLEGLGGDQAVSFAFSYLADLVRAGQWGSALREARALSCVYFEGRMSPWRVLRAYGLVPLVPTAFRRAIRSVVDWRRGARAVFLVPINRRFAAEIGMREVLRGYEEKRRAAQSSGRFHAYLFEEEFAASPLESYECANAAFGYESRCPFLDRRLVEFCLMLPREQRIKDGLNRVIVRRALGEFLPEVTRRRGGKGNANPAFATALLAHGREEMKRVIVDHPERIAPFVDVSELRKTHDRLLVKGSTSDAYAAWTAVTLSQWLEHTDLAP